MMNVRHALMGFAIIVLMAAVGFSPSQVINAQERATSEPERAPTISRQVQSQIERGNVRGAQRACGDACMSSPRGGAAGSISSGSPVTADYTCNGGNCSCAGAVDCVAMAEICAPDTIGCNDYGCACKEGD